MGIFTAGRYIASIDLVDVDELKRMGIRCVLFDRDNTCVPRSTKQAPGAVLEWFDRVHAAGLRTCMVSNNFHSSEVIRSARELKSEVIHHAMKPFPFAVRCALDKMGVGPEEAVLIGDQLYTDIAAGNLAGVRTILVRPQSTSDLWYTHILRIFESMLLSGKIFEGE